WKNMQRQELPREQSPTDKTSHSRIPHTASKKHSHNTRALLYVRENCYKPIMVMRLPDGVGPSAYVCVCVCVCVRACHQPSLLFTRNQPSLLRAAWNGCLGPALGGAAL